MIGRASLLPVLQDVARAAALELSKIYFGLGLNPSQLDGEPLFIVPKLPREAWTNSQQTAYFVVST